MRKSLTLLTCASALAFAAHAQAEPTGDRAVIELNKAQTRKVIEEGWNKGNVKALDALIAEEFVNHTPVNPKETREEFKNRIVGFRKAFPDLVMTVDDMVGEGDRVVTRWTARGTHQGEFRGVAPTGKKVEITGIAIDRMAGGKRVEGWAIIDMLSLLQQLGVTSLPPKK